jgi:hypothetical protein
MVTGKAGAELADGIVETAAALSKPVMVAWLAGRELTEEGRQIFRAAGIPVFHSVGELTRAAAWDSLTVAGRKRLLSAPYWDQTLLLLRAQTRADAIEADAASLAADGIGLAPPPLLSGNDLIAHGLRPGPHFKPLLDAAYNAQLEGHIHNTPQAITWVDAHQPDNHPDAPP